MLLTDRTGLVDPDEKSGLKPINTFLFWPDVSRVWFNIVTHSVQQKTKRDKPANHNQLA